MDKRRNLFPRASLAAGPGLKILPDRPKARKARTHLKLRRSFLYGGKQIVFISLLVLIVSKNLSNKQLVVRANALMFKLKTSEL